MMGAWKTKCGRCKKMKPEEDFNDIDFGYGVYHKSSWCKFCDARMDKERWEYKKKWLAFQKKVWGGKPKMKGWNEVGEVWKDVGGELILVRKGFVQTEEWVKKENKKLAYPFGWPPK